MDLDLVLWEQRHPEITEESASGEKRHSEKWARSNLMNLMIMKRYIPKILPGVISDDEDAILFLKEIK